MSDGLATAYYVAPTAARADLRHAGIVPDGDIEAGELWLYDDEGLAKQRAEVFREHYVDTPEGNADVWRVDVTGLELTRYPQVRDGQNVTVDAETIAPERLVLIATL